MSTHMSVVKVIAGLGCLTAAIPLGFFAWISLVWGGLWFPLIPAVLTLGLVITGIFLISRRGSLFSFKTKAAIAIFFTFLIVSPALLDIHIRHERGVLQQRARAFLLRPIPRLLVPDSTGEVGGYFVDTNAGPQNGVFGYSRLLIERYATKGRIRWSAVIQGEFACTGDNCLNGNISNDVITNNEVRRYSDESHAILVQEWRMGFWQWVEDTIEMKDKIPEIEEEDFHPAATNGKPQT